MCTARQATDDNIIRRMCFASWVRKARYTHTHLKCVILIAFTRHKLLRERSSMLRVYVRWYMVEPNKLVLQYLTFRGPCVVIYSYNKSQQDALFLRFILVKNSTCFGQTYCPSSASKVRILT